MEKLITTKSGNLSEERREFLRKTGSLAVMAMFGVGFFTSCSSEDDPAPVANTPNQPPSNDSGGTTSGGITINSSSVAIDLRQVANLNTAGGWILIVDAKMLVINTGGGFSALTSVCTHSGCDRSWSLSNNQFLCSCHGSRFTTTGAVVQGPANRPLSSFSNSRSGDILTIIR
jgi:cytochrome b6-f complex iron-sulfur subunit